MPLRTDFILFREQKMNWTKYRIGLQSMDRAIHRTVKAERMVRKKTRLTWQDALYCTCRLKPPYLLKRFYTPSIETPLNVI